MIKVRVNRREFIEYFDSVNGTMAAKDLRKNIAEKFNMGNVDAVIDTISKVNELQRAEGKEELSIKRYRPRPSIEIVDDEEENIDMIEPSHQSERVEF